MHERLDITLCSHREITVAGLKEVQGVVKAGQRASSTLLA